MSGDRVCMCALVRLSGSYINSKGRLLFFFRPLRTKTNLAVYKSPHVRCLWMWAEWDAKVISSNPFSSRRVVRCHFLFRAFRCNPIVLHTVKLMVPNQETAGVVFHPPHPTPITKVAPIRDNHSFLPAKTDPHFRQHFWSPGFATPAVPDSRWSNLTHRFRPYYNKHKLLSNFSRPTFGHAPKQLNYRIFRNISRTGV